MARSVPGGTRRSPPGYRRRMAHDEQLADRVRTLAADTPDLVEKKMFGGLAFLVGGNMAIAASGQGGLLVRVDPDEGDRLLETTAAEPFVMRGRPMTGWLRIAGEAVTSDDDLRPWVERGVAHAASLPSKR